MKKILDIVSAISALCVTMQRNQAGALYLLALSSIALAGYALHVVAVR